jgi:hypothetical protein
LSRGTKTGATPRFYPLFLAKSSLLIRRVTGRKRYFQGNL